MGKSSRHINGVILGDPSGTSSDPIGEKEGQAYCFDCFDSTSRSQQAT